MRISLKIGTTYYPLAGEAGVSERVHSSAADFGISARAVVDTILRVRASHAQPVDRANLLHTVRFSTTRLFDSPFSAFLAALDDSAAIPRSGILVMDAVAPDGGVYRRTMANAVISPPARRVIGASLLYDYSVDGGAITDGGYIAPPVAVRTVAGTLSPNAAGALVIVPSPSAVTFPNGQQWSTDGTPTKPASGVWKELYQAYLVTPAATTVNALAPKEGYTATGSQSTASKLTVNNTAFSSARIYWLYDNGGSPKWVLSSDGALASRDSEAIASGDIVFPSSIPSGRFVGGTGATWQDSPTATWLWLLKYWTGGSNTGNWVGIGTTATGASWTPFGAATGTPAVS